MSIVNDITGFAVKILKENGMWDNAIVVMSAENMELLVRRKEETIIL